MTRSIGLIVILAILVSACGDSDSDVSTTEPAAQSSGSTSSTAAPSTAAPTTQAQAVDALDLAGTDWNVTDYSQASGTITNVWKTDVTVSFGVDGTMSGSAGCNTYEAIWSVSGPYDEFESGVRDPNDGQDLIIDSLSWTERACEDEAIMEQEAEILDLLQRGARWVLIRDSFNLRDDAGAFLFEAEPV